MWIVLVIMLGGMLGGYLLRRRERLVRAINWAVLPSIYLLLFLMGVSVGNEEGLLAQFPRFGLTAFVLTVGGLAGSIICVRFAGRHFFMTNHDSATPVSDGSFSEGSKTAGTCFSSTHMSCSAPSESEDIVRQHSESSMSERPITQTACDSGSPKADPVQDTTSSGSSESSGSSAGFGYLVVLCFALGILYARIGILPDWLTATDRSFWALGLLILLVGAGIGSDPASPDRLRRCNWRLLSVPAATIVGTLVGAAAVSFFLSGVGVVDAMMVGAGFGYYSLSSVLITSSRGIALGTIALLANLFREMIALLMAPMLVRYFGPLSLISAGGATTADTTLPVIARYSGKNFIFVSVIHGIVVDTSVPLLVAFFSLW